jgi:hypothetical protein
VRPAWSTALAWFRNPLRLTLLYAVCLILLGLPLIWTFDPDGSGGVFAGLILGAFVLLIPTFIYLVLPRRIGMTLFSIESLAPWVYLLKQHPIPTRILSAFILWSLIELPMYGFELLGLLDPPDALNEAQPPLRLPTFLLLWLVALTLAYAICGVYASATPMTVYPPVIRAIAFLFIPVPPLIAAWQFARRVFHAGAGKKGG